MSGLQDLMYKRERLLITDIPFQSSAQDLGAIVPTGSVVAVTALQGRSSVANVFHLQDGGATSPADDRYDIELGAAGDFAIDFPHPLICDGLAGQWDAAGTLRINIAYKILE